MDTDCPTLEALARGVAQRPRLTVRDGEPGAGWSIDPVRERIHADPRDRATLPAAEVHGLVCHEAAHAGVTRYPWLVPRALLEETGVAVLLNAVEDCRIETWLLARLPGTRPWITAYNDRLFPADGGRLVTLPPFLQFALGIVHRWWHGDLPEGLDARAVDALNDVQDALAAAVAAQPPTRAVPDDPAYARSGLPAVLGDRASERVDGFEQQVRLSAARSWGIVWHDVLPVYRALVALTPGDDARRMDLVQRRRVGSRWLPGRPGGGPARRDAAGVARARHPPATSGWEAARRELLPAIDALVRILERVWRPTTRVRWRGGALHGQRPDLRRVMARGARPDRLDVWQHKSVPDRRDPRFLLAIDLSGSMAGLPIEAAFRGLVLVAEALDRLGLPFALYGYQDALIPFKAADRPLAVARPQLETLPLEVVGRRPSGRNRPEHNWDGPVLDALVAEAEQLAGDPVLLVVSDGAPSGPAPALERLRAAIARVPPRMTLVGVGIGAAGAPVADVYPHAVRCSLSDLPQALGRCLQDALHAR